VSILDHNLLARRKVINDKSAAMWEEIREIKEHLNLLSALRLIFEFLVIQIQKKKKIGLNPMS
jgi:hypothetical protein